MAQGQTKLLYPGLAGFYETMLPIAGALVRIVVGIMFLMHVSTKFKLGADAVPQTVSAAACACYVPHLFFQSGEHRDNRLNLVGCRGHQGIVARHTLRGSLQNDFSQVCL